MADNEPKLPPKLDLRKSGILKSTPNPPEAPEEEAAAASEEDPKGIEATPAPTPTPAPKPSPKPIVKPAAAQQATVAEGDAASETTDISAESEKVARPTPSAAKPVTVKAVPIGEKTADAGPKKSTTKIALDAAKPKTIKATPKPVAAGDTSSVPPVPKPKGSDTAAKRKTSRISLESVLGEDQESGAASGAPKTIRLKRPGAEGAPKVATQAKTVRAVKRPTASGEEENSEAAETAETADTAAAAPEGESQTRRKTVVVKRPQAGGGKKLKVARPDAEQAAESEAAAAEAAAAAAPAVKGPDRPGPFFAVVSIAATLVVFVMVYMLLAQVIGPNFSMTDYSYAKGGPDLVWPGKLTHH